MDELNRRVRIAYEQMKRHEDEPSGRLYNLWRDKYNQANDELTKFIKSGEKEVTPVEVEEVMDEDDFIQAGKMKMIGITIQEYPSWMCEVL